VKRIIIALSVLGIIAGVSACGGSAPATNAQAWAAGYKYGDTTAALYGFVSMVGDGAKLTVTASRTTARSRSWR
jgi:hypothetical protein